MRKILLLFGAILFTISLFFLSGKQVVVISRAENFSTALLKSIEPQLTEDLKVAQTKNIAPKRRLIASRNLGNFKTMIYTVKPGDTIWDIARQFRMTVDQLMAVNNLTSENLQIGQKLKVRKTVVRITSSRGESERFLWPAHGGITSRYGERWGRMHEGIDIDGSTGDPVVASKDGIITFAGWESGYGNLIIIDHLGPYKTKYGHLSKILVQAGQRVEAGELIGRVGSTGRSTGSHLHFEILINGSPVNPLRYLP